MRIITLTTVSDDNGIVTTVHKSESEALAALRQNFALGDDHVSDDMLVEHVQGTGTLVNIVEHEHEDPAHVLLVGNPIDGMKVYAIDTTEDPRIEDHFANDTWWIAEVNLLD